MIKSLLFGGEAGQGIDRTASLMGEILISAGFFCFLNREYSSLIRGGHNFDTLTFSDQPIFSTPEKIDLLIAFDNGSITNHQRKLRSSGHIIGAQNLLSQDVWLKIDAHSFVRQRRIQSVFGNNIFIGALIKYFGLPISISEQIINRGFSKKEAVFIKEAIKIGYGLGQVQKKLIIKKKQLIFLKGNAAIAQGALKAGLEITFYYPITPATSVFDELKKLDDKQQVKIIQLENEIAVINAALGASFAGAMSFVGTSGPGFALMTESLSLAGMAEIPIVLYLAMRPGPATGMPTFTAQDDLKFALSAGHGEFPKVVLAPGDASESFTKTIEAFYLAYKYRIPVIILGDKHLSESYFSFTKLQKPQVRANKFISQSTTNYKNYKITKTGVSPRLIPGQGPIVRATSYEHDEDGHTTEDGKIAVAMKDKRQAKNIFIAEEINNKLKPINIFGKGENLIISWGSTKGAILDSLSRLDSWRFLQIIYLDPFPADQVMKEIKLAKRVILVENSSIGFLSYLIHQQTGFLIKDKILKYDGQAFSPDEIINKINH